MDEFLLEKWKICVEMANDISKRRDTINNVFITFTLAISTVIITINNFYSILFAIIGILVSLFWIFMVKNLRDLNKVKFNVILDIEKKFEIRPFTQEWELIKKRKSIAKKIKINENSFLELFLPIVFIVFYLACIFLIIFFGNGGI